MLLSVCLFISTKIARSGTRATHKHYQAVEIVEKFAPLCSVQIDALQDADLALILQNVSLNAITSFTYGCRLLILIGDGPTTFALGSKTGFKSWCLTSNGNLPLHVHVHVLSLLQLRNSCHTNITNTEWAKLLTCASHTIISMSSPTNLQMLPTPIILIALVPRPYFISNFQHLQHLKSRLGDKNLIS